MKIKRNQNRQTVLDISSWTIIKIIIICALAVLLYYIRSVLYLMFIVTIIVAALSPSVEWLQKKKVPRLMAVLIVFAAIILVIIFGAYIVVPPLLGQLEQFATEFPKRLNEYLQDENTRFNFLQIKDQLIEAGLIDNLGKTLEIAYSQLSNVSSILINQTFNFIGYIVSFVSLIFLTFYFLLEEEALRSFLMSILPHKKQISVFNIIQKTNKKTGLWLRGQLMVVTAIGLMTYIGLSILGVKFPLVMAIIAGVASIVPMVGPIAGATPAVLVGMTQSVWVAVGVILMAILIQQIEGQFITPKIMGKIVGLSPVTILVALLIGGQLAGIWGMMIAIPAAAAISVLVEEWNNLN